MERQASVRPRRPSESGLTLIDVLVGIAVALVIRQNGPREAAPVRLDPPQGTVPVAK